VTVPASYSAEGPASRPIGGRITDKDGGFTNHATTIDFFNVAPSVEALLPSVTMTKAGTAVNGGVYSDPGVDAVSLSASTGVVTDNGEKTWSWSNTTTDGPEQSETVIMTAVGSDGEWNTTTFELAVIRVPLTLAISGGGECVQCRSDKPWGRLHCGRGWDARSHLINAAGG
jgi:hypothetical protein